MARGDNAKMADLKIGNTEIIIVVYNFFFIKDGSGGEGDSIFISS